MPSIHHVQIAIPSCGEDAARCFYGDVLGFQEVEKPDNLRSRGGVWFETGNLQLHLGVDRRFTPATKAHVAFEVGDADAVRGRCIDAGHQVTEDQLLPGYERFYVDDPFGNRTEILQPVESPPANSGVGHRFDSPELSDLDLS